MLQPIYAHSGLHKVLSRLQKDFPALSCVEYLPDKASDKLHFLEGAAVPALVLDGTDILPEDHKVFTVPAVHNAAALLLGGNQPYRSLWDQYDGGVCFCFPGETKVRWFSPQEDCHVLCKLTDTELGIPETEGAAEELASLLGMDLVKIPADYSLLYTLLQETL